MSKLRKQVMLDEDLEAGLKILKARTGASEGEILRRALRAHLERAGVLKRPPKRAR